MSIAYQQGNSVLNEEFGGTAHTAESNYHVALSTTPISQDGSGATEPSGGAYARVTIANNKTTFSAAASGSVTNLISVEFPESTASWGSITHIALFDATTSGNILYYGALDSTRAVATATTVLFAASGITATLA